MHGEIAGGPAILGRPFAGASRLFTGPVYRGIRGVAGLVGAGVDAALARLAPLLGSSVPGPERELLIAVLNGVLGDYLAESGNALAVPMRLRHRGEPLELTRDALRAALPQA